MKAVDFERRDLFKFTDNPAYPPEMVFRVAGHTACKGWVFCRIPSKVAGQVESRYTFGDDYLSKFNIERCGKGIEPVEERVRLPKKHTMAKPIHWTVERKPRAGKSEWRVAFRGSEKVARETYDKIAENLRQGVVRLRSNKGEVVASTGAPNLRTRW